jgi:sorbitol-specific phosphotransferase system component IIA
MTISVKVPHGASEGDLHLDGTKVSGVSRFPGLPAFGYIYITADVADEETVTIGSVVFEFDRAEDGVTAGRIAVTGHADDTAANATNALITAINARTDLGLTAVDVSANIILLVYDTVGTNATALAETMAGANNVVSAATLLNGAAEANKRVVAVARVPTANEVTAGAILLPLTFTPTNVLVQVRTTSTGAFVAWDGKWLITGGANPYVLVDNAGSVDWATTSTVHITAFE